MITTQSSYINPHLYSGDNFDLDIFKILLILFCNVSGKKRVNSTNPPLTNRFHKVLVLKTNIIPGVYFEVEAKYVDKSGKMKLGTLILHTAFVGTDLASFRKN